MQVEKQYGIVNLGQGKLHKKNIHYLCSMTKFMPEFVDITERQTRETDPKSPETLE